MLPTFNLFIHPAAVFCGAFSLYFTSEETEAERWCDLSQVTKLLLAQTEFEPRTAWLHTSELEFFWEPVSLRASLDRSAHGGPEMACVHSQRKGSPGMGGLLFLPGAVRTLQCPLGFGPLKRFEEQPFPLLPYLKMPKEVTFKNPVPQFWVH